MRATAYVVVMHDVSTRLGRLPSEILTAAAAGRIEFLPERP